MFATAVTTKGKLKELLGLFLPIFLMTFSSYLFLLMEKVFLGDRSVQDMEAAVSAAYACQIMQVTCISIAALAQVFVGQWHGQQNWKLIGPGLWQFIWFSILSMIVTMPFNMAFGKFYFQNTAIESIVWPYFLFLISINFLFPLGTTLTCFYFGLKKTRLVLFASIGSQAIKLIFTYLLIFGWENWIPPMGLMGGAISTLIAQGGFCLLLLAFFLFNKEAEKYQTRQWRFQPKLFWECIQPGTLRAISRISTLLCWASITYLMTTKGGDYLLVLSIGGTLFLFLPCFSDALCQAQISVISNMLGAKQYAQLNKAFLVGVILVVAILFLLAFPMLFFPASTFHFFFPKISLDEETIRHVFLGVWLSFTFFIFNHLPLSYILSFKDTKFLLFMGAVNWLNGYLVMYIAIKWMQMPAHQFWTVLTLMHGSMSLLYYFRMKWLQEQSETVFSRV